MPQLSCEKIIFFDGNLFKDERLLFKVLLLLGMFILLLLLELKHFSAEQLVFKNFDPLVLLFVVGINLQIVTLKLHALFMQRHLLVLVVQIIDSQKAIQRPQLLMHIVLNFIQACHVRFSEVHKASSELCVLGSVFRALLFAFLNHLLNFSDQRSWFLKDVHARVRVLHSSDISRDRVIVSLSNLFFMRNLLRSHFKSREFGLGELPELRCSLEQLVIYEIQVEWHITSKNLGTRASG